MMLSDAECYVAVLLRFPEELCPNLGGMICNLAANEHPSKWTLKKEKKIPSQCFSVAGNTSLDQSKLLVVALSIRCAVLEETRRDGELQGASVVQRFLEPRLGVHPVRVKTGEATTTRSVGPV